MGQGRYLFLTDLDAARVRARLRGAVDAYYSPWGRRPVRGHAGRRAASLYRRRRLHHPFQIRLRLTYGDGAVRGRAGLGRPARAMMALMTVVLAGVAVTVLAETGDRALAWGVAAAGAFGVGLIYAIGRQLSAADEAELVAFAAETLDAEARRIEDGA